MKFTKDKALQLIDEKISHFQRILNEATYDNCYNEDYKMTYYGTETLLGILFSEEEIRNFRNKVSVRLPIIIIGRKNKNKQLQDYKKHIENCLIQLKVYKEKIQILFENDLLGPIKSMPKHIPFVSMSFDESDQDINQYITNILKALRIEFETGERYSKYSIPEKVKDRIKNSHIFIGIFTRRDKKEKGGYTTSSWLLKELGIAQGFQKDIIAWVEKGVKDIAGLNYEKEVIYFERNNIKQIKNATIKFLEALKEHKLI